MGFIEKVGRKTKTVIGVASAKTKTLIGILGALAVTVMLGGNAMAEEGAVSIPSSPIDTSGLADGAFSTFGDTVTTVFPYIIALCAVFFAINFIKRLAGGRR